MIYSKFRPCSCFPFNISDLWNMLYYSLFSNEKKLPLVSHISHVIQIWCMYISPTHRWVCTPGRSRLQTPATCWTPVSVIATSRAINEHVWSGSVFESVYHGVARMVASSSSLLGVYLFLCALPFAWGQFQFFEQMFGQGHPGQQQQRRPPTHSQWAAQADAG